MKRNKPCKTILKQVNKLLRDNNMTKSTVTIVKNNKVIENVPCSIDGNGKQYFNIPTVCRINDITKGENINE